MATNRCFINYSETYDMNTVQNKLTVVGIHTPSRVTLWKLAKGLFLNFKKYKIHSCDMAIACASQLPIDPLGVGTEPGMVAPQDLMNPMLFKAVTGESMNYIIDSIYGSGGNATAGGSVNEQKLEGNGSSYDPLLAYYTLLADNSWRKALPQMGMQVTDLRPMVHDLATLRPLQWNGQMPQIMVRSVSGALESASGAPENAAVVGLANEAPTGPTGLRLSGSMFEYETEVSNTGGNSLAASPVRFISTGSRPLPALDTMNFVSGDVADTARQYNPVVPRIYMGCLVMPPAVLQSLYFRMRITWHIEFMGFRPSFDNDLGSALDDESQFFYKNTYEAPGDTATAQAMSLREGSIDAIGMENINVVNTSIA